MNYQKSLNNDQYPKTMLKAKNILKNYRYDNGSKMKHHNKGQGQNNDKDEDKNEYVPLLAFMMDRRCYCC